MVFDITRAGGILNRIKTPLTLGGLALLVFYGIVSKLLDLKIFPQLAVPSSAALLSRLLTYTFVLAITAVVLGIASYVISQVTRPAGKPKLKH